MMDHRIPKIFAGFVGVGSIFITKFFITKLFPTINLFPKKQPLLIPEDPLIKILSQINVNLQPNTSIAETLNRVYKLFEKHEKTYQENEIKSHIHLLLSHLIDNDKRDEAKLLMSSWNHLYPNIKLE